MGKSSNRKAEDKARKKAGKGARKRAKSRPRRRERPSRFALYEAAVQNAEADLDFIEKVWRKERGGLPERLKEDFCGTASLAAHFVNRHRKARALGVDLDETTLAWGREHRVGAFEGIASRIALVCADVRDPVAESYDVVTAFNFSYWVFTTRQDMLGYLRAARRCLDDHGLLFLDAFGGSESVCAIEEETEIEASVDPDGTEIPPFSYVWEQEHLNPVDHALTCHIHFKLGKRKKMRRAFSYHWRFWTLPELRELLEEAGFSRSEVYVEGWDDEADEPDGIFRRKTKFDNGGGWIAYLVAFA